MIFLKLIVALLPVVLLLAFIYWKDAKKEPFSQLAKAFGFGMLSVIPVLVIGLVIKPILGIGEPSTNLGVAANEFLGTALIEEGSKLLFLWLVLRKNPHFDEHFDGIVYAVFVGLGFAAFENIKYVMGADNGWFVAILRAVTAVPGHYADAVIMGYCYSLYHFVEKTPKNAIKVLLMPVMAHGAYDFLLSIQYDNYIMFYFVMIIFIYFCYKLQRIAYDRIVMLVERDKKSPIC